MREKRSRQNGEWLRHLLSLLIGTAVLAAGIYYSYIWLTNKPKAHKWHSKGTVTAPLVEVVHPRAVDVQAQMDSYAKVIPYRSQTLSSRVTSQVVSLSPHLIPGEIVKKGDLLVALDETDYKLALRQSASAVANAGLALETELENSKSAAFELSLVDQNISKEQKRYLLRYPHIAAAKSALASAEAAYEKAKVDLERCRIRAPFDAVVLNVEVAIGDTVSSSKTLATLAEADRFWVRIALSPRELDGIDIPGYNASVGSSVKIRHDFWPSSAADLTGVVETVEKMVDDSSKMAYILVRVDDPLGLHTAHRPLLLNSFVKVRVVGKRLKNVLVIPSTALRGDGTIWILRPDHTLQIRKIPILWREESRFMIDAKLLQPGESVITTVIETPVDGMKLRIADGEASKVSWRAGSEGNVTHREEKRSGRGHQ